MSVVVRDGEPFEVAWNRLMRELISNGVLDEWKKRMFYTSKSEEKRAKRRAYKKSHDKHNRFVRKEKRG